MSMLDRKGSKKRGSSIRFNVKNPMTIPRPHHLVYGTLHDYLTGEDLTDTDDERIRQSLSRMMVEKKGYSRDNLQPRNTIESLFNRSFVTSTIELTVSHGDRQFMIIRYGPGSLVSRERSAIAAARILNSTYRIPLAVVTNGEDAELLDTESGRIIAYGLDSIPDAAAAVEIFNELRFLPPVEERQKDLELRILNAFDLERCCL